MNTPFTNQKFVFAIRKLQFSTLVTLHQKYNKIYSKNLIIVDDVKRWNFVDKHYN
jgi:hypothetical protein